MPSRRRIAEVLLPADAQPARIIVCERRGQWAVWLRRELQSLNEGRGAAASLALNRPPRLDETRSLADAFAALSAAPASFLVLEVTLGLAPAVLDRLVEVKDWWPLAAVAVVGPRRLSPSRLLWQEAGAVCTCFTPRKLAPLAVAAAKHVAKAPAPPRTIRERIWNELPWGAPARQDHRRGRAE